MTRAERPQPISSITAMKAASPSISLAGKTCDQVVELSDALNAYLALERFVEPEYADDAHASVPPSRAELTALLHAVNINVQRKIGALADITTVLQAQVTIDAALAR